MEVHRLNGHIKEEGVVREMPVVDLRHAISVVERWLDEAWHDSEYICDNVHMKIEVLSK